MLAVFFVIAFFAAALSAIAGFGSALILISAASLMFDIKWSIAMTTFFYCFNTGLKTYHFRTYIDWHLVFKLSLFAMPGVFIGAYCLLYLEASWLMLGLASISISYLLLDIFKLIPKFRVNDVVLLVSGFIYGFISGAVGSGSLIKAIVFKQINLPKEAFVASMAASALPLNVIKLSLFLSASLLALNDVPAILALLVASYMGTIFGKHLLMKVNQTLFNHLVRIVLLLLSLGLVARIVF